MAIKTESYGRYYRNARLAAGLTQVQVSARLGIDQRLLSKYETDKAEPSNSTLKRMAALYMCSVDQLLGYEGAQPPDNGDTIPYVNSPVLMVAA